MSEEVDLHSDAERERVAVSLREHCAAGRLTLEELSERLDEAYRARTAGAPGRDRGGRRDNLGIGGADIWRVPPGAKELSRGGTAS